MKINGFIHLDILGMNLQCIDSSLQIRLLYDNSAVKSTRTKKCLIKYLRAIRCCKDYNTL